MRRRDMLMALCGLAELTLVGKGVLRRFVSAKEPGWVRITYEGHERCYTVRFSDASAVRDFFESLRDSVWA